MKTHIVFLLFFSFIADINSQKWFGTYKSNNCQPGSCCANGQVVISPMSTDKSTACVDSAFTSTTIITIGTFTYTGPVAGKSTVAIPTGYTTTFNIMGYVLTLTLSSDSSSITMTNSYNVSCGNTLIKNTNASVTAVNTCQ